MEKTTLRIFTITLALAAFCFAGCSKNEGTAQQVGQSVQETQTAVRYKDGVYKAVSGIKDDWGGNAEVTITIKDGKITDCEFLSYEKDGTLKGEDYGKTDGVIKNAGLYKIAQNAIKNAEKYGPKLVETQRLDKVDAIAGATVSYELFENVVGIALKQAKAE
ncbi:MAG: FMN-binding protein [Treponema sp.]|uniref:FMN-binding protein n=1 Tax=Treponema sp. TaxID=166 RepID=UPI00361B7861